MGCLVFAILECILAFESTIHRHGVLDGMQGDGSEQVLWSEVQYWCHRVPKRAKSGVVAGNVRFERVLVHGTHSPGFGFVIGDSREVILDRHMYRGCVCEDAEGQSWCVFGYGKLVLFFKNWRALWIVSCIFCGMGK